MKKTGLGRGLSALFDDNKTDDSTITELKLSEIELNREQPRKKFDEESLKELADSINEYGVIQPLLVRPQGGGGYQLVAGERRFRASRMAGKSTVPVVIRELSNVEATAIALVENLQREDLNPVEEAEGYRVLMNDFNLTQEEVAERVGKSRSTVANSVRLLNLPDKILLRLKNGDISAGHARSILPLREEKMDMAVELILKGATVRDIEKLAKEKPPKKSAIKKEDNFITEIKISLEENIGRKINIKTKKSGGGMLSFEFFSKEDLVKLANSIGDKM